MGRKVRRVAKDWEHPKNELGSYIPLLEGSFKEALEEYNERKAEWNDDEASFEDDYAEYSENRELWDEEHSVVPEAENYMPNWTEAERTHIQMYEDCSEGTPISPVMETSEELASWLADNNASAFAGMTATYDEWLATINRGWAPSAIFSPMTGMQSGVTAMHDDGEDRE